MAAPAAAAAAADREIEITFYYQPDDTGRNTLNKSIEIDGDELTIEESRNDGANRYIERDATADEIALVETFVRQRIEAFEFKTTDRLDAPKVEIKFEFDGETRSIEVEEQYAAGEVPKTYIDLQKRFFEDLFR